MIQYPYVVLRSPCRASYSLQVQRGQIFQRSPFAASSMVCGDCGSEFSPCFFAVDVRLLNERETIYHYIPKETSSSGNEQDTFFSAGQNPSRAGGWLNFRPLNKYAIAHGSFPRRPFLFSPILFLALRVAPQ